MCEKKKLRKEEGKNVKKRGKEGLWEKRGKRGDVKKKFWWWTAGFIRCGVEGMGVLA